MRKTTFLILVSAIAVLLLGACVTPYKQNMNATNRAIDQAVADGADRNCANELRDVLELKTMARDVYQSCDTKKGMELLREARSRAEALCPDGDTDGDGVKNTLDKCPGTPMGARVNEIGCWVLKNINFDTDKSDIKAMYHAELNDVIRILKDNPSIKIEIQGHTDSVADDDYNQILSEARAKAVMQYFIKGDINESRLRAAGMGESRPIATNETDGGRARNRRIELKVK